MSSFVVDIGGDATGIERASKAAEKALGTVTDSAKRSAIARKQAEADAAAAAEQAARAQLAAGKVTEDQYRQVREAAIQANGALREVAAEAVQGQKAIERAAKSRSDQIKKMADEHGAQVDKAGKGIDELGKKVVALFTFEKIVSSIKGAIDELGKLEEKLNSIAEKQADVLAASGTKKEQASTAAVRAGLSQGEARKLISDMLAARPNEDRDTIMVDIAAAMNSARKTGVPAAGRMTAQALKSMGEFSGGTEGVSSVLGALGKNVGELNAEELTALARKASNDPEKVTGSIQRIGSNREAVAEMRKRQAAEDQAAVEKETASLAQAQQRQEAAQKKVKEVSRKLNKDRNNADLISDLSDANNEQGSAAAAIESITAQLNQAKSRVDRSKQQQGKQQDQIGRSIMDDRIIRGVSDKDNASNDYESLSARDLSAEKRAEQDAEQRRAVETNIRAATARSQRRQAEDAARKLSDATGFQKFKYGARKVVDTVSLGVTSAGMSDDQMMIANVNAALSGALSGTGVQAVDPLANTPRSGPLRRASDDDEPAIRVIIEQDRTSASPLSPVNR